MLKNLIGNSLRSYADDFLSNRVSGICVQLLRRLSMKVAA